VSCKNTKEFIAQAKSSADKFKGLTIADDDEIAEVSKNIKELNTDQDTLEEARDILMENAGINIVVEAASYIRLKVASR
jgi:3-deoxy-D-manno-octulosonic-acid transferase